MPPLRREQFNELASRLKEPDGGFSVRVATGKEPKRGFMVSQAGTERAHAPAEATTGAHLQSYASDHSSELGKPARYMGGWHDPYQHKADLDISRRYASHDRARAAMWGANQDALFHLKEERSEHNFAKLGTTGTALGRYLHEPAAPHDEYADLQKAARHRAH